jgi:hypothetical protein
MADRFNKDNISVCPVSGKTNSEADTTDKFWTKENKLKSEQSLYNPLNRGPWLRKWSEECQVDVTDIETIISNCIVGTDGNTSVLIHNAFKKEMKRKGTTVTAKMECYVDGLVKIASYFSKKRSKDESNITHTIQKEIYNNLTKYVNKKTQCSAPMFVTDLHSISDYIDKKRNDVVDITQITDPIKKKLITYYTQQCLSLWGVIRIHTELGREKPDLFPLPEFIDSALSILETGFYVLEQQTTKDGTKIAPKKTEIFPQDNILSAIMPNLSFMREQNSVNRTKKTKKNKQTTIKNSITTALNDAVVKQKIPPYQLRPDKLPFESLSESLFVKTKIRKRSKQPTSKLANPITKKKE